MFFYYTLDCTCCEAKERKKIRETMQAMKTLLLLSKETRHTNKHKEENMSQCTGVHSANTSTGRPKMPKAAVCCYNITVTHTRSKRHICAGERKKEKDPPNDSANQPLNRTLNPPLVLKWRKYQGHKL